MTVIIPETDRPLAGDVPALTFAAPYLIEKLVKERIVTSGAEAEALFTEVKRFLVLVRSDLDVVWDMWSLRVDEAWHQFVLFTLEYVDYCFAHFGAYVHHAPSNAPEPELAGETGAADPRPTGSFEEFAARYAELFGEPLPDAWYDERSITVDRRVVNDHTGRLAVLPVAATVELRDADGEVLLAVDDWAAGALHFLATTGAFYVRELPGGLTDDEKAGLVAALVEYGLLRVAP